jgi:peptidyl-tRNA hydrolase
MGVGKIAAQVGHAGSCKMNLVLGAYKNMTNDDDLDIWES